MHSNRRSHILKLAQEKLADTSTDGLNMSTDKGRADWVRRAVSTQAPCGSGRPPGQDRRSLCVGNCGMPAPL